jgi:hypothetical protein
MGSHKAFDANRIAQALTILDAWRASTLPLRAFATQHHHKYDQLRAWLRHEPRWRGMAQPKMATAESAAAVASSHSGSFQRVRVMPEPASQVAPRQLSPSAIRIECANASASRSASVHFQPSDLTLSAQWLAAYLRA